MMGSDIVLILFAFLVNGVFGDTDEVKTLMEGDHVFLNTSVTKDENDTVKWYFNDILIAVINGHASGSCSYDGEGGRFRGRLVMDHKTGSLNITEIRTEHTGRYEAAFIKTPEGKTGSLNRKFTCDSTKIIPQSNILGTIIKAIRLNVIANKNKNEAGINPNSDLSPGAVAGIVVVVVVVVVVAVVLLLAVCGVIDLRSKNGKKKNIPGLQQSSEEKLMIDKNHTP